MTIANQIIRYVAKVRAHGTPYKIAVGMAADRFGVSRDTVDRIMADLP